METRMSHRFGDVFLEKFIEWVEQNVKPELVYLDDEPLHQWARRNGYSKPLTTVKRADGPHFIWPKDRYTRGAGDGNQN